MNEAIFGFLGVLVGSFIPWIKEAWGEKRLRGQHAVYLAAQAVCVLDEYVQKCVDVVGDNGTVLGRPAERDENGQEYYVPQVMLPEPPAYPDDVDWKSIDSSLMYRLLALPNNARDTDRYIRACSEHASLPDHEELFEARCEGYAILGLEALALAKELRETYKIPNRNNNKWNLDCKPENYLKDKRKEVEYQRKNRATSISKMLNNL